MKGTEVAMKRVKENGLYALQGSSMPETVGLSVVF